MRAEEENLMKLFQNCVSRCVHRGLMSQNKAQRYYRSGKKGSLVLTLNVFETKSLINEIDTVTIECAGI